MRHVVWRIFWFETSYNKIISSLFPFNLDLSSLISVSLFSLLISSLFSSPLCCCCVVAALLLCCCCVLLCCCCVCVCRLVGWCCCLVGCVSSSLSLLWLWLWLCVVVDVAAVVVVVCVWHAEKPLCVHSKRLRVYIQNVPVCTGNKSTRINTF